MKRIIRNLIVAAPLATFALTMTPGSAMAFPGPQQPIAIPTPDPHPGPGDISDKPKPPKPPKGPGNFAIPKPKPVQPKPANPGNNSGGEQTGTTAADDTDAKVDTTESTITVPDACLTHECDASAPVDKTVTGQDDAHGMDLAWLLAGGAVVSASGIAFAASKRSRRNA